MYQQKLYKNGNSVVVSVPKVFLRQLGLRDGSRVVVKKMGNGVMVVPDNTRLGARLKPEFYEQLDKFAKEHEDIIKALAKM